MSPTETAPLLQVIVGSTRPGRAGLPVAQWIAEHAAKTSGFDVEIVDLAEIALPMLDEPHHPGLRKYTKDHTKKFSALIDRADSYVLVLPEYNHGYPAPVKNAFDFLSQEWAHKPIGIVSYGGVSGGTRAANALKPVLAALRMILVHEGVVVPFVATHLGGDDRRFAPNPVMTAGADDMLAALSAWVPAGRLVSGATR